MRTDGMWLTRLVNIIRIVVLMTDIIYLAWCLKRVRDQNIADAEKQAREKVVDRLKAEDPQVASMSEYQVMSWLESRIDAMPEGSDKERAERHLLEMKESMTPQP